MNEFNRREFLKKSTLSAASLPFLGYTGSAGAKDASTRNRTEAPSGQMTQPDQVPEIVDTNVYLHDWPFRNLKYSRTRPLVNKLRSHRVKEAWADSFHSIYHKNLDEVNERLTGECRAHGEVFLVPVGSVNPAWPDWEEDLRRCHENYKMRAIRLYPAYHGYDFDHPDFIALLGKASERDMLVQIAITLEDSRVHHPIKVTPSPNMNALPESLRRVPDANVQLINSWGILRGQTGAALIEQTNAVFDIARIEGIGALHRLIDGNHWYSNTTVPVERMLFGSYAPYFPCESAIIKLFSSPLTLQQMEAIMEGNAKRVLSNT